MVRERARPIGVRGYLVALVVVLGLLVLGKVVNAGDRTDDRATEACHRFVSARLQLPQTARFGGDTFALGRAHHYSVRGHVEARNVDGGSTGRSYTCLLSVRGDSWHLDHLTLTPG